MSGIAVSSAFRLVGVLFAIVAVSLLSACASGGDGPSEWSITRYNNVGREAVAENLRSILEGKDFGYRLKTWQNLPTQRGIIFETEWNDQFSRNAIFAGTGKRRKVFVESFDSFQPVPIEEIHTNASANAAKSGKADASKPVERPSNSMAGVVYRSGVPHRLVTRLALAVEVERNDSIVAPNSPEIGDWTEMGQDKEEVEQIIARLKHSLRKATGNEVTVSRETEAAYKKYFIEQDKTPEQLAEEYKRKQSRQPDPEK